MAGHVWDEHTSYTDAAYAEVREELGLTVTALEQVTEGWRPNRCRRGAAPDGRYGHHWRIYRADVAGDLCIDPGSYRDMLDLHAEELAALAKRTPLRTPLRGPFACLGGGPVR